MTDNRPGYAALQTGIAMLPPFLAHPARQAPEIRLAGGTTGCHV